MAVCQIPYKITTKKCNCAFFPQNSCNFVAEMKTGSIVLRRTAFAWLLLWVFVPMMVLSVVHQHERATATEMSCTDCDHHVAHAGHLLMTDGHAHDCVLCQLASVVFVGGATLVASAPLTCIKRAATHRLSAYSNHTERLPQFRAPPCVFSL